MQLTTNDPEDKLIDEFSRALFEIDYPESAFRGHLGGYDRYVRLRGELAMDMRTLRDTYNRYRLLLDECRIKSC